MCRRRKLLAHFAPGRLAVALHVRRGDVTPIGMTKKRHTADAHYLQLAATIRKQFPDAQLHLYSQTSSFYPATSFRGFQRAGIEVHLDGDPLTVLAHLAEADVFVMAKSAFSSTAALFNPNCVVYEPFWYGKLVHWAYASTLDHALQDCLAGRLKQPDDPKRVARAYVEMLG